MNLIQNANVFEKRNKTWLTRQERIKRDGSEYFTWAVPITAAAAVSRIEIANQFPRAKKYAPLDFVEVSNNGLRNLTLIINGSMQLPVPAGVMRTLDNAALWEIGIRNDDAAVATILNDIIVSLRRQPLTIDQWARRGA